MNGCGLFPYGFGNAGMAEVISPLVGVTSRGVSGAVFLNASGDFECDEQGDVSKTSYLKQRVALLLRSALGTIVGQQTLGLDVQRAVDNSWRYRMNRAVEKALAPAVLDGSIEISRVVLQQTSSLRASITVVYVDLATGQEEEVTV